MDNANVGRHFVAAFHVHNVAHHQILNVHLHAFAIAHRTCTLWKHREELLHHFFRPELLKVAECAGDENDGEEHDAEHEAAAVRALKVELVLGKTGDERDQTEDAADEHEEAEALKRVA